MTVVDLSARGLAQLAGLLVLGVVVGVVGTGVHRMTEPWGLVMALVMVVLAAVLARAWSGAVGVLVTGLGVVTTVSVLGTAGPGGDVLVVADLVGYVWFAGALASVLALVAPRSWFADAPRERS